MTVDQARSLLATTADDRLAAGLAWTDSGLVFTTPIGTPIDPANFSHAFARLAAKAGLGTWHLHEARHSAASIMLAMGTPLEVVSEVLGHASIRITKDIYGHLRSGEKRHAAAAMTSALLAPIGGPQ